MLSTVLQYSTIDFRFLETNLRQCSKMSDEVIVVVCEKLFNGKEENQELLDKSFEIIAKFENAKLFTFERGEEGNSPAYYHNLSRALGTEVAQGEWLLFLDTDEILDDNFEQWFKTVKDSEDAFWLTCYWYFREPIYQATKTESAGLLIRKKYCSWVLDIKDERKQLFSKVPRVVNGDRDRILWNGEPLVHHYSWVRTKEDMLLKVSNWGERRERNWIDLVEKEFSRPFNGTDFVHGYEYKVVEDKFNLK